MSESWVDQTIKEIEGEERPQLVAGLDLSIPTCNECGSPVHLGDRCDSCGLLHHG